MEPKMPQDYLDYDPLRIKKEREAVNKRVEDREYLESGAIEFAKEIGEETPETLSYESAFDKRQRDIETKANEGDSSLLRGLKSGIDNLQGSAYGLIGLTGDLFGSDDIKNYGIKNFVANEREASVNASNVHGFFNASDDGAFGSIGNFLEYAGHTVGSLVPSVIESMGSAFVGGVVGGASTGGAGAIPGAAVGLLGKKAIKNYISKEFIGKALGDIPKELLEQGLKKEFRDKLISGTARELTEEAFERGMTQKFKQDILTNAYKSFGSKVGSSLVVGLTESGGNYAELAKEGHSAPVSSLLFGMMSGASESFLGMTPDKMLGNLNKPLVDAFIKERKKKGARGVMSAAWDLMQSSVGEGGQEALQSVLSQLNKEYNDPNFEITSKESFMEVMESFAAGLVGGTVFGGGTKAAGKLKEKLTSGGQLKQAPVAGEVREKKVEGAETDIVIPTMETAQTVAEYDQALADHNATVDFAQDFLNETQAYKASGTVDVSNRLQPGVSAQPAVQEESTQEPLIDVTDFSDIVAQQTQKVAESKKLREMSKPEVVAERAEFIDTIKETSAILRQAKKQKTSVGEEQFQAMDGMRTSMAELLVSKHGMSQVDVDQLLNTDVKPHTIKGRKAKKRGGDKAPKTLKERRIANKERKYAPPKVHPPLHDQLIQKTKERDAKEALTKSLEAKKSEEIRAGLKQDSDRLKTNVAKPVKVEPVSIVTKDDKIKPLSLAERRAIKALPQTDADNINDVRRALYNAQLKIKKEGANEFLEREVQSLTNSLARIMPQAPAKVVDPKKDEIKAEAKPVEKAEAKPKEVAKKTEPKLAETSKVASKEGETSSDIKDRREARKEKAEADKPVKRRRNYSWDRVSLSSNYTLEELGSWLKEIQNDPDSKTGITGDKLSPFNKTADKQIDALTWAMQHHLDKARKIKKAKEAEAETDFHKTEEKEKAYSYDTLEGLSQLTDAVNEGLLSKEELRDSYNKLRENADELKKEMGKKYTLAQLKKSVYSHGTKKADYINVIFNNTLQSFYLDKAVSYSPFSKTDTMEAGIQRVFDNITEEDISTYAEKMKQVKIDTKQAKDKQKKAISDPETHEDFEILKPSYIETLSLEKRKLWDELRANKSLERNIGDKEKYVAKADFGQANTAMSEIIESVHTKKGHNLFVVQLEGDRIGKERFKELISKAKTIGGASYVNAGQAKRWDATEGFQFTRREDAETFKQLESGSAKIEVDPELEASKIAKTGERFAKMAETMTAQAEASLNQDRKANTARRARMAASAESDALVKKAVAETLGNLAEAAKNNEIKYLNGVRYATDIDELNSIEHQVVVDAEQEKYKRSDNPYKFEPKYNRTVTEEESFSIKMPSVKKHVIESWINDLRKVRGQKAFYTDLQKSIKKSDSLRLNLKALERLKSIDGISYSYHLDNVIETNKRLNRMGIKTDAHLRMAIRELNKYIGKMGEVDKIKTLERALAGTKKEGFFPTPIKLINNMLEKADLKEGMKVLEPSAGKGDIADALKNSDVKNLSVDVAEYDFDLKNLLEAKKHNLVSRDAFAVEGEYDRIIMNPPFEKGADMEHVQHAFNNNLKDGGRLVAIMSESPFSNHSKKAEEFRTWLEDNGGYSEQNEAGSFTGSDSFRQTGVNTRTVVIDKSSEKLRNPEDFQGLQGGDRRSARKIINQITGHNNVEILENVFSKDGVRVFGKYTADLIQLAESKEMDSTARHEAMHEVYDKFLTTSEKKSFDAHAKVLWPNMSFDESHEKAIEAINDYHRDGKTIARRLKRIADKMIARLRKMFGKERLIDQVNEIYDRALSGKLAERGQTGQSNYRANQANPEYLRSENIVSTPSSVANLSPTRKSFYSFMDSIMGFLKLDNVQGWDNKSQDDGWLKSHFMTPFWQAKKNAVMRVLTNIATKRDERRTKLMIQTLEGTSAYTALNEADKLAVGSIIVEGGAKDFEFKKGDPQFDSLSSEQQEAYKSIRTVYNRIRDMKVSEMKADLAGWKSAQKAANAHKSSANKSIADNVTEAQKKFNAAEKSLAEAKTPEARNQARDKFAATRTKLLEAKKLMELAEDESDLVTELDQEILDLEFAIENLSAQKGYFPRTRENGRHLIYFKGVDENGKRKLYRQSFKDSRRGRKEMEAFWAKELAEGAESYFSTPQGLFKKAVVNTPGMSDIIVAQVREKFGKDWRTGDINTIKGIDSGLAARWNATLENLKSDSSNEPSIEVTKEIAEDFYADGLNEAKTVGLMQEYFGVNRAEELGLETAVLQKIFFTRGHRKHEIARLRNQQGEKVHVAGYNEDIGAVTEQYVQSYVNSTVKAEAAQQYYQTIATLDPLNRPNEYGMATDFVKEELRGKVKADEISGRISNIVFGYYMAGRISSAMVNLTQNYMIGIPTLMEYLHNKGVKVNPATYTKLLASTAKAQYDAAAFRMGSNKTLSSAEVEFLAPVLAEAKEDAKIRDSANELKTSTEIKSKTGKAVDLVKEYSMKPFEETELNNRLAAALLFYRTTKKAGISDANINNDFRGFVKDSHFEYKGWNKMRIMKNKPMVKLILSPMFHLATYGTEYTQAMATRIWPAVVSAFKGDWRAAMGVMPFLAPIFASTLLLRGAAGEDEMEELYLKTMGRSMTKDIEDAFGKFASDTFQRGVVGAMGLDLSGSLAGQTPPQIAAPLILLGLKDFSDKPLAGISTKIFDIGFGEKKGVFNRLVDAMPLAIRSGIQGIQETGGYKTFAGNPIYVDGEEQKLSGVGAAMKVLGFNPTERAEFKGGRWKGRTFKEKWSAKKRDIVATFVEASHKGNTSEVEKLRKEIIEINKTIEDMNAKYQDENYRITPITKSYIKSKSKTPEEIKKLADRRKARKPRSEDLSNFSLSERRKNRSNR